MTDGLPDGRDCIPAPLVSFREMAVPFPVVVGPNAVNRLDAGLIAPAPPVEFIAKVFPELTPKTPPEMIEINVKAVSFVDATAETLMEGLKGEGVIAPIPPVEFIVENPPDAPPETTAEDTVVSI